MNDILTNGLEIKQRIISEIRKASKCIYIAMAWFTDRDIANEIIEANKRNIHVDIILSSNQQNESVRQMFYEANVNIHAFETGDERGIMHHKFCLIDNRISINGSYNYSYNASNNNVENIQVSDDINTYQQLFAEFQRLKYNIDHQINVNVKNTNIMGQILNESVTSQYNGTENSFHQQLSNLIYATANIDTDSYKIKGYDDSRKNAGNIEIFNTNYIEIKEVIKSYATDDTLNSKKNTILQNINSAFDRRKDYLKKRKENDLNLLLNNHDVIISDLNTKKDEFVEHNVLLNSGDSETGDIGILQINNDIEKSKVEKNSLESSFILKKFWTVATFLKITVLTIFIFYLSIFFASAIYKVFFEENNIRNTMEAGVNPGLPQIVDANAIIKIFSTEGALFGIMALFFFLIPVLLSNLKLIGSRNKIWNNIFFVIGIVIFDVLVAVYVAMNTDELKNLLIGQQSELKVWEVYKLAEFWLIFVFGMLPLIVTHYLINSVADIYRNSQPEFVDAEKNRKIQLLDKQMIDLISQKELLRGRISVNNNKIADINNKVQQHEQEVNKQKLDIHNNYNDEISANTEIYDNFIALITSGRIFTDEILSSVSTAYKTGYIEYLPELYADKEVSIRVRQIEQLIKI